VPGDYDGDGKTDVAVWDPVYDNWYIASSLAGGAYLSGTPKKWGSSGAMPVGSGYSIKSKDYDGDGKADLTIFYPSTAHWYNYPSSGVAPYGFSALPSGNSLPSSSCSESSSVGTIDYLLVTPTPVHPITSASCRISTSTAYVGDPITWTATSSGGDGSFTYQWSGAVSGNQVSTTTVYSIPGLKQAYVTISSNGTSTQTGYCTNPSGSTTVNIISLPAINTSCAAYNNNGTQVFNVSTSTQVTWKATSTGGYGTFTYQWTNGSTGSSTSSTYNTVGNYYLGATSTSASSTYTVSATANCSPFPLVVSSSFSLNGLLINIPTGNLYVNQSFPVLADISKLKDSNGNSITLDPNTITYSWNGGIAAASSSTSLLYNTVSLKTITLSISGQTSSSTPYYAATSSVVNILLPTSTSTEQ
jgi:hypothetical protein